MDAGSGMGYREMSIQVRAADVMAGGGTYAGDPSSSPRYKGRNNSIRDKYAKF